MTKIKKIILISSFVILLDQLSKIFIRIYLDVNSGFKVLGNFFKIMHVENEGAAWSVLNGKWILLTVLGLLFLVFIFRCIIKDSRNTKLNIMGYSFLIGGIIGNIIDRIIYQRVTDFLSFRIFGYSFPVFNIADTFIVIGMVIFIIDVFLEGKEEGPIDKEYKKIREGKYGKSNSRRGKY